MRTVELGLGGGSLTQVAHRTIAQMMSYIVDCPDGEVVMIDGGNYCIEEGADLHDRLMERGGRVNLWIITHAHRDHLGTLLYLLENYSDLEIDMLCFAFPDTEWLSTREDFQYTEPFLRLAREKNIPVYKPQENERLTLGGVCFEFLSLPKKEEYANYENINATGMIFKLHFPERSVLFLADFNKFAEEDYIRSRNTEALRCDICQMAHHGQNGVTKRFYELIMPKICLYCAPKWLWENNLHKCTDPATVGMGPFKIPETRQWMRELGAEAEYTHVEGDIIFI